MYDVSFDLQLVTRVCSFVNQHPPLYVFHDHGLPTSSSVFCTLRDVTAVGSMFVAVAYSISIRP